MLEAGTIEWFAVTYEDFPMRTAPPMYSSHTLEHLYLAEARRVLVESLRGAAPGGTLRLALPNGLEMAQAMCAAPDDASAARTFNARLLAHPEYRPGLVARARNMAGGHVHRWQPTPALVAEMLCDADFTNVTPYEHQVGTLPDLENVETRPASFFLEGTKPTETLRRN